MFSEVALEAAPTLGNAHLGQRGSGHSVVSLAQQRIQTLNWNHAASVDTSIRPYVITQNPAKGKAAFEG